MVKFFRCRTSMVELSKKANNKMMQQPVSEPELHELENIVISARRCSRPRVRNHGRSKRCQCNPEVTGPVHGH